MVMLIPVFGGQFAQVDDEDYEDLIRFKWHFMSGGYVVRKTLMSVEGFKYNEAMHRRIMGLVRGDSREIDHKDLNKLNMQRANLRVCTRAENVRNVGLRRDSRTGLKGVCKSGAKWCAYVHVNGKRKHLGTFETEHLAFEFASLARDMVFGEFANHGFAEAA